MDYTKDFFEFIEQSTTAPTTGQELARRLEEAGFEPLSMGCLWSLQPGGKYYVMPYQTVVIPFVISRKNLGGQGFRIVTAHTDNPGFKIKPNPEIDQKGNISLNVEKYGGPILSTWLDRPLSIAGLVALRSKDPFQPIIRVVDLKKPVVTIPNLAIHMNPEINKSPDYKVSKDLKPIFSQYGVEESKSAATDQPLKRVIAKQLEVAPEEILYMDLNVYCCESGRLLGDQEQFISSPRIDDLAMVYAGLQAIIEQTDSDYINMAVFFDNEEIGSRTRQGADSMLLLQILERIKNGLDVTDLQFPLLLNNSFIISADGAHAYHPNYSEKNDETNRAMMNQGVAIKISGARKYSSEADSIAVFEQLCEAAEIPYQWYVNHSDIAGGSTIGPMISSYLPIRAVDIGVPMLAMHSTRELMGKQDFLDSIKVLKTFYR